MKTSLAFLLAITATVLTACVSNTTTLPPEVVVLVPDGLYGANDDPIDFSKDIKPILEANCLKCHNDNSAIASISFETRKKIMAKSSDRRPILVPGDPERSTLFLVTTLPEYFVEAMPADGHKLKEEETWKIYRWILEGAKWPEEVKLKPAEGTVFVSR